MWSISLTVCVVQTAHTLTTRHLATRAHEHLHSTTTKTAITEQQQKQYLMAASKMTT